MTPFWIRWRNNRQKPVEADLLRGIDSVTLEERAIKLRILISFNGFNNCDNYLEELAEIETWLTAFRHRLENRSGGRDNVGTTV